MSAQVLTLKSVLAAIRANADKLGATTDKPWGAYRYRDGCGCAIGVGFTEETVDAVNRLSLNNHRLRWLADKKCIEVTRDDLANLAKLQFRHDEVCESKVGTRKREVALQAFWACVASCEAQVQAAA